MWQMDNVPIVKGPEYLPISALGEWVYSAIVHQMVYQISMFLLELIYMQHKQMVYVKLHRHHYLVLVQNPNCNAYSTPWRHEVWDVEQKMVTLGIDLCYNTFSHLGVQHKHYPEHGTVCLSIFFTWIVFCIFPDQWHHFCGALLSDGVEIP